MCLSIGRATNHCTKSTELFAIWTMNSLRTAKNFSIYNLDGVRNKKKAPREFIGTRTLFGFHVFGLLFDLIVKIAPNSHLQQNAQTLTIPLIPMNSTNKNGVWKYVRSYKLPTNETLSAENQGGICCFFSSLLCKTTEKNHAANKMKQRRVHVIPNNECDVCLQ